MGYSSTASTVLVVRIYAICNNTVILLTYFDAAVKVLYVHTELKIRLKNDS